jgi:hypothetical protein
VERLGNDGRYVPYLETERESTRVDATTMRTVERTYGTNADGVRTLTQESREESQKLGSAEKTTRSVANPDANGRLQIVQKETRESKTTGPGVSETDSTVLLPDANGGLVPSRKTHVRELKKSDQVTEYKQSVSLPDGNGNWRESEVRQGKITGREGENRIKEEDVLHPDLDDRLSVDQHTVTKEEQAAGGQKRQVMEIYSAYSAGNSPDGMQLNERVITVNKTGAAGEKTSVQEVQARNPGDPAAGVRTSSQTIDIVRPVTGGTSRQEQTVRSLGPNGSMGTVWVDLGTRQVTTPVVVDMGKADASPASSGPADKGSKPAVHASSSSQNK